MRLIKPAKGLIGIDITSATVQLVELKPRNKTYQIDSVAGYPLPEKTVVERRIQNINDVSIALRHSIEHARPVTKNAVVAVPTSAAITKTLTLPALLGEDEIEEHILENSDRYISFPFSDVEFDFQRLGSAPFDEEQQQVVLVACRRKCITQLTEVVQRAGLEPVAIEVAAFAIARSLSESRRQLGIDTNSIASVGVVEIDTDMVVFHVMREGSIVYSRDSPLGGLSDGWSQEKACNLHLDDIVQRVARTRQLYDTMKGQHKIQHIILAGGPSSIIQQLAEQVANECNVPVSVANPFHGMYMNKRLNTAVLEENASAMFTAAGLAMRTS